ncbi:MAG: cytochrome, partial [Steroidobacteraceae bacterium]|nr:cytochrome [Steroidobacteraceae bacterium]
ACHGRDGDGDPSRGVPRLGGQHYGYLMRQMYDAVDGRRVTLPGLHSQRIAPLDFPQVRAVADYLSRIGWPPIENSGPPTRE